MTDTEKKVLPMWSAIHHDNRSGRVFVWYTNGDRLSYKVKHRSYTPHRGEYGSQPCGMKDIYGKEMYEIIVDGKTEYDIKLAHRGRYNHIAECDVDYRTRWLQLQYDNQDDIKFNFKTINICYLDIEVATKGKFPAADKAEVPINCVTIYLSKQQKYYVFGLNREISEKTNQLLLDEDAVYINCYTEYDLLEKLFTMIGESEVDILTAWNGDYYDFPYMVNRADQLNVEIKLLSRLPGQYKTAYVSKRTNTLIIGGTEVIDFLKLYRKYTLKERDNFKLDTIGQIEVGESKAELPDGYQSWINYWDDYVLYNFQDVRLMKRIEDKCRMFETTVTACSEARVPFSAIFEAKKMLVGFLLNFMHKNNLTLPPLREFSRESFPGAYVYSTPNFYNELVSYDYRSMYPSIMIGANISPETKYAVGIDEEIDEELLKTLVKSPWTADGTKKVYYRKDKVGIVPQVVKILFDGRTALKNLKKKAEKDGNKDLVDYYDMKQQTYKILGNSLYGLLGNPYFQLYDIDNSASITCFGRELIQSTIEELCYYFNNDFETDERFKNLFNTTPKILDKYRGYVEDDDGKYYNRISHGDTDSFFVKYNDFYAEFKDKIDKEVDIIVFKGNDIIKKESFDITISDLSAKKSFNSLCQEYFPEWQSLDKDKKIKTFYDGILFNGEYRIIYNRYLLTDFCRVLDAGLMETVLASIMENYANRWNYYENTIFLKREKCILQAIVTAKKKYICRVESNEDVKYFDKSILENESRYVIAPKFAITGMDIVRSSTTPFTRERLLTLINDMFITMDKKVIRGKYLNIKQEFFDYIDESKIYDISVPSGVKKNPPKWTEFVEWDNDQKKGVDWRLRSASVWNHLIDTDPILSQITYEPIFEGSKVKFIKVAPNQYKITAIAYVGIKCPDRLLDIFTPDWEEQWKKTFAQTMDKIFVAVGWDSNLEYDETDNLMEFL